MRRNVELLTSRRGAARAARALAPWLRRAAPALAALAACGPALSCQGEPGGDAAQRAAGVAAGAACGGADCATAEDPLPTTCEDDDCVIEPNDAPPPIICPSGSCDPGPVNGNGVYVVTGGDYCLRDGGGVAKFCPEAFVNAPPGGVELLLHNIDDSRVVYRLPIEASLSLAPHAGLPVELVGVSGDETRLSVRVRDPLGGPGERAATDGELEALRFRFGVPKEGGGAYEYEMQIKASKGDGAAGPPGMLRRYEVSYRRLWVAGDAWASACAAGGKPTMSSFLGRKKVDALSAHVVNDDAATTISCETGAIETCLLWGYAPWNPQAKAQDNGDYLFGACLQAKRAAYFIGHGDPTSYTESGTEIYFRDPFGIQTYRITTPEAVWSPRGAECLNDDRLRRPELRGHLAIPADVPRCEPLEWTRYGKLATSPDAIAPF